MTRVALPFLDEDGGHLGELVIRERPTGSGLGRGELIDLRDARPDDGLEPVRLTEGGEYRFEFQGARGRLVRWEPEELFDPDDETGNSGRLRPRLSTGRVELVANLGGQRSRAVAIEVRSIKLGYLDDYRNMLASIARLGSELLLERFAASAQRLQVDGTQDAATLYQRFALLQSLLRSEALESGIKRVLATPYVAWRTTERDVSPGASIRGGSQLARRLCGAGARTDWDGSSVDGLVSLPRRLAEERTEETLDSVPNRFVKHALGQWLTLVTEMQGALMVEKERTTRDAQRGSAPIERGLAEADRLSHLLQGYLRHPLFSDVGDMSTFPGANQVLQKGHGYRQIFETYVLYEFGSRLAWSGGDDVFGAGQRNVATLYEYWVFLELARIVGDLCQSKPDLSSLIEASPEAISLGLRRGIERCIGGIVSRRGRTYRLELHFNREFRSNGTDRGSWTRTMRPDCSLCITPLDDVAPAADNLWLHFDAKYRVTEAGILGSVDDGPILTAKDEDLLKMHAYRDAIVRAAGAYVVFPGNSSLAPRRRNGEAIPSLGAFSLRPSAAVRGEGAEKIQAFLHQVIDQLAEQRSPYERVRYWQRTSYAAKPHTGVPTESVPFLRAPAADTIVLLGYLRSPEHARWVRAHALYNVRADPKRRGSIQLTGEELSAQILLTYSAEGTPEIQRMVGPPLIMTRQDLLELEYPQPGGELYLVFNLAPVSKPSWFDALDLRLLISTAESRWLSRGEEARAPFSPLAVSWLDVMSSVTSPGNDGPK